MSAPAQPHHESSRRTRRKRQKRPLRSYAADGLLTIGAVIGAVCLVLVMLAVLLNISLIMFRTGSMAPTMPAGSIAVVREISASEISIGDVVTVDRDGRLPITHRVTDLSSSGVDAPDERIIVMRGDANDADDPHPYVVEDVRRVIFSVPYGAHVITFFSQTWVLAALTLGMSAVVGWAFWPRETRAHQQRRPRHARPSAATGSSRQRRLLGRRGGGLAVLLLAGVSAVALPESAAHAAAPQIETITGQYLQLTSVTVPERQRNMQPGDSVEWDVGIAADAPEGAGDISVSVMSSGELPLTADIRQCTSEWVGDTCPGHERTLEEDYRLPLDGSTVDLTAFGPDEQRWIRVEVTFPGGGGIAEGTRSTVQIRASLQGETIDIGPEPGDGHSPSPTLPDNPGSPTSRPEIPLPGESSEPEAPDSPEPGDPEFVDDAPSHGETPAEHPSGGVTPTPQPAESRTGIPEASSTEENLQPVQDEAHGELPGAGVSGAGMFSSGAAGSGAQAGAWADPGDLAITGSGLLNATLLFAATVLLGIVAALVPRLKKRQDYL